MESYRNEKICTTLWADVIHN